MLLTEQQILQTLMQWRTRVSASAWVIVKNTHTSEDIFQNVVLKAMTRDIAFDTEAALLSWSFITARREALDWVARNRRESRVLSGDILQRLEQTWQQQLNVSSGEKIEALRQCLDSTPEETTHILKLRYSLNFSCEEVASKMNLTVAAVYKRLSRLHSALKLCIEKKLRIELPEEHGAQ